LSAPSRAPAFNGWICSLSPQSQDYFSVQCNSLTNPTSAFVGRVSGAPPSRRSTRTRPSVCTLPQNGVPTEGKLYPHTPWLCPPDTRRNSVGTLAGVKIFGRILHFSLTNVAQWLKCLAD